MKKFLISVIVALGFSVPSFAQTPAVPPTPASYAIGGSIKDLYNKIYLLNSSEDSIWIDATVAGSGFAILNQSGNSYYTNDVTTVSYTQNGPTPSNLNRTTSTTFTFTAIAEYTYGTTTYKFSENLSGHLEYRTGSGKGGGNSGVFKVVDNGLFTVTLE